MDGPDERQALSEPRARCEKLVRDEKSAPGGMLEQSETGGQCEKWAPDERPARSEWGQRERLVPDEKSGPDAQSELLGAKLALSDAWWVRHARPVTDAVLVPDGKQVPSAWLW